MKPGFSEPRKKIWDDYGKKSDEKRKGADVNENICHW